MADHATLLLRGTDKTDRRDLGGSFWPCRMSSSRPPSPRRSWGLGDLRVQSDDIANGSLSPGRWGAARGSRVGPLFLFHRRRAAPGHAHHAWPDFRRFSVLCCKALQSASLCCLEARQDGRHTDRLGAIKLEAGPRYHKNLRAPDCLHQLLQVEPNAGDQMFAGWVGLTGISLPTIRRRMVLAF